MEQLGRYQIRSELGRGGSGDVYAAFDPLMRRNVAVKLLSRNVTREAIDRLREEAVAVGKLNHQNIVAVYEFRDDDLYPYLVMELVEGQTLRTILENHVSLSFLQRLDVLYQLAEGLNYAHENGVIHRDIKPENLVVTSKGTLKILDFGIARALETLASADTQMGKTAGTVRYLAPELIPYGEANKKSDIYSYGIVFYEILSGRHPFESKDDRMIQFDIKTRDIQSISTVIPDCPESIQRLSKRLLERNPDLRCDSLEDALLDIPPVLAELKEKKASELFAESEQMYKAGDYRHAGELSKQVLELAPMHKKARQLRKAIKDREQELHVEEKFRELRAKGEMYLRERQFIDAITIFEECLAYKTSDAETLRLLEQTKSELEKHRRITRLFSEARWQEHIGNLQTALEKILQLLQIDPDDREAQELENQLRHRLGVLAGKRLLQQAEKLSRESDFDAASAALERVERFPELASLIEKLEATISKGKEQKRLEERAAKIEAGRKAVELALAEGRLSAAEREARALVAGFPDDITIIDLYRDVLAINVRAEAIAEAHRKTGELLTAGQVEEADRALDEILAQYPDDEELLQLKAKVKLAAEAHVRELGVQQAVIEITEFLNSGQLDEAVDSCRAALERWGDHELLVRCQATVALHIDKTNQENCWLETKADADRALSRNQPSKALEILHRARDKYPNDERIQDLIAGTENLKSQLKVRRLVRQEINQALHYSEQGHYDEALRILGKCLERVPDDLEIVGLIEKIQLQQSEHVARHKVLSMHTEIDEPDPEPAEVEAPVYVADPRTAELAQEPVEELPADRDQDILPNTLQSDDGPPDETLPSSTQETTSEEKNADVEPTVPLPNEPVNTPPIEVLLTENRAEPAGKPEITKRIWTVRRLLIGLASFVAFVIALFAVAWSFGHPGKSSQQPTNPQLSGPSRSELAESRWKQVQRDRSPSELRDYISSFPNSPFGPQARSLLEQLEWTSLNRSDVSAIQSFLSEFPDGIHGQEAKELLSLAQVEADKAAISSALAAYASAIRHKDESQLRRVWPGIPSGDLYFWQQSFKEAKSISFQLVPLSQPIINGTTARAQCRRTVEKIFANGRPTYSDNGMVDILLRRRQPGWAIASVSAP